MRPERIRREADRRPLGDVGDEEPGRVFDDDDRDLGPRGAVVQHLAANDDVAGLPAQLTGVSFATAFVLLHSAQ